MGVRGRRQPDFGTPGRSPATTPPVLDIAAPRQRAAQRHRPTRLIFSRRLPSVKENCGLAACASPPAAEASGRSWRLGCAPGRAAAASVEAMLSSCLAPPGLSPALLSPLGNEGPGFSPSSGPLDGESTGPVTVTMVLPRTYNDLPSRCRSETVLAKDRGERQRLGIGRMSSNSPYSIGRFDVN